MSYKQRAQALAKKLKCSPILDEGNALSVDFPDGYIDQYAGVHGWIVGFGIGEKTQAWRDLYSNLQDTVLVPCTTPGCCTPLKP